jgi:pimeloyl-ACP methyl ester carboxylesterase
MFSKYNFNRGSLAIVAFLSLILFMNSPKKVTAQGQFEKLDYPFQMHEVSVGSDMIIAYADEGTSNKEVVLFIHGLGSYAPAWKYNIKELSKSFRCIVVDLVGYGMSTKGQFEADMTFHANNLFALMESLKITKFNIAGHSMGGQIAIHMALNRPQQIKGLVLLAPAGIETFNDQQKTLLINASTPEAIAGVSDEQYKANLALNFYKKDDKSDFMYTDRMLIKSDPQFKDYCYVVSEGVKGMLNEPVFKDLNAIDCPALIIYGLQDQLIPNRYLHPELTTEKIGLLAKKHISNASLEFVDKAGHFVNFDQPETVNKLISNFLNN